MSLLFVDENSAKISYESNRCVITYSNGMQRSIPIETLESISIMGHAQITTQCIQECFCRGIPVSYYSKGGRYFGRLQSTGHVNTRRQRLQCRLYETDFALELSKKLVRGKMQNQIVILQRYAKSKGISVNESIKMLCICNNKIQGCRSVSEVMGYEGQGAKAYFDGLALLVEPAFAFHGRNKRPPKDEFNAMLSLGYSVLMNELYGQIEMKGLNPYFGFMHRDKEKHPTLASDMMEEWRAVIVDSTVMSLVNGHEIHKEHFYFDTENPGCFLTREGMRIFLAKLEKKLQTEVRYLDYVDYAASFRRSINLQLESLIKAMESEDASIYKPVRIR